MMNLRTPGLFLLAAAATASCATFETAGDFGTPTTTATPTGTPTTPPPSPTATVGPNDLALNEVFFSFLPTSCLDACDANRDGSVSTDDEFVEIVNVSNGPRSLAGIGLHESNADPLTPRYVFGPNVVLPPNGAAVVFGGFGGFAPDPSLFGGALIFEVAGLADLDLSNTSDYVELRRDGLVLRRLEWGDAATANFSETLTPDLGMGNGTGIYQTHPAVVADDGTTRNASPGWRSNFTPF